MFELRLVQGSVLKKVIEAIKDLVNDANFDCCQTGFSLQAMDSSHVALVSLLLRSEGFEHFRCDRSFSLGMHVPNLFKLLKCSASDDILTIKADDGTDFVTFMFENPSQDKISDIEMKLMDIDSDHLGIPDVEYDAIVRMPASEFATICTSLATIGDTVSISVSKQGVTFSTKGDIGTGNITCRQNASTEKPEQAIIIEMKGPIVLTFALKYITTFTKATSLSNQVTISLSSDMPMVIEYKIAEIGYIRYYLAPKIEEDEMETTCPQPETRSRMETRATNQAEPDAEKAGALAVVEAQENNGSEAENARDSQVKTEIDSGEVKPGEFEAMEHELKMETQSEAEMKAEVAIMEEE